MSSLYQIDQGILSCLDMETGEIIDPEKLDSLQMERQQKIEGVALWVKNLSADVLAFKAEKEAFAERERIAKAKVERLKAWLTEALEGQKFSTAKCAVSFRKSARVEIEDPDRIPKHLMVETVTIQPDKNAIKEILKSGQEVGGCCLVENLNAQIK